LGIQTEGEARGPGTLKNNKMRMTQDWLWTTEQDYIEKRSVFRFEKVNAGEGDVYLYDCRVRKAPPQKKKQKNTQPKASGDDHLKSTQH